MKETIKELFDNRNIIGIALIVAGGAMCLVGQKECGLMIVGSGTALLSPSK